MSCFALAADDYPDRIVLGAVRDTARFDIVTAVEHLGSAARLLSTAVRVLIQRSIRRRTIVGSTDDVGTGSHRSRIKSTAGFERAYSLAPRHSDHPINKRAAHRYHVLADGRSKSREWSARFQGDE